MLRQQIGPQKGLTEQGRNDPDPQQGRVRQRQRAGQQERIQGQEPTRFGSDLCAPAGGYEFIRVAARRIDEKRARLGAPVRQARQIKRILRECARFRC